MITSRQYSPIGRTPWHQSPVDAGDAGVAVTIDWGDGSHQRVRLTAADCDILFAAPPGPAVLTLLVQQDGTGGRLVEWDASESGSLQFHEEAFPPTQWHASQWPAGATVRWPGGTPPTLSTDPNAVDIFVFLFDGLDYHNLGTTLDSR